jgi:hypothetical protein
MATARGGSTILVLDFVRMNMCDITSARVPGQENKMKGARICGTQSETEYHALSETIKCGEQG